MSDTLDREITAYETLLPGIREKYGSVWALVVHEKLVNTFKDFRSRPVTRSLTTAASRS